MFEGLFQEKGLSLDRLKCLLEVADAGSIVVAADRDPVKQSQFSRQIKDLEAFFKCELTKREGKNLKLTKEGHELVEIIRGSFIALDEFKSNQNQSIKEVSIGAGDSILQWSVVPHLPKLKKHYPNIKYSLHNLRSKEINMGLSNLSLDFGIVREESVVDPLVYEKLIDIEFLLYVPKALIPKKKEKDIGWILSEIPIATQVGASYHKQLSRLTERKNQKLNIELVCESYTQAYQALKTGNYAAILPSNIRLEIDKNSITELELPLELEPRSLVLAYNSRMIGMKPFLQKIKDSIIQMATTSI